MDPLAKLSRSPKRPGVSGPAADLRWAWAWRHPMALALALVAVAGCADGIVTPADDDGAPGAPIVSLALTGPVSMLSSGTSSDDHLCAVGGNGVLTCWGGSGEGQARVPSGLGPVAHVAVGGWLTCAAEVDGKASCWGYNTFGQATVPPDLDGVLQVAPGFIHACALRNSGTVTCWGSDLDGRTDVPAGLSGVIQLSAGPNHTCAVTAEGAVTCWGSNVITTGQNQTFTGQATVPGGLGNAVRVSGGGLHTCAVMADNSVACWGFNQDGQATVPAGLGSVVQVAAGAAHTCALLADGTVRCWGRNAFGQTSVPAGLDAVVQVAAGNIQTCALKNDGTLTCWGQPRGLVATGVHEEVAVGAGHACAIEQGGFLKCWGLNNSAGRATVPAGLGAVLQVAAAAFHTCAVKADGSVVCWGGDSGSGQAVVPVGLGPVSQTAGGARHTCALQADGTVTCWGSNRSGGNVFVLNQATVPTGLTDIVQIAAGDYHTCAVNSNGSVTCWGSNVIITGPNQTFTGQATVPGGIGTVVQVAAHMAHTCAVKTDGTVTCWGDNTYGQTTVPVGLADVVQVATGQGQVCALRSDGSVSCWGRNHLGQATPPPTLGPVAKLAAGGLQTCAILVNGSIECWGNPTSTSYEAPGPSVTPPGENVAVTPIDPTTGEPAAATLVFDDVIAGGETTVTSGSLSGSGAPEAPSSADFKLGNPATYYEITTTATFSGAIQICIDYSTASYGNESKLRLLHGEDGSWVDITDPGYPNTTTKIICGTTSSLSPFAVAEANEAPVVTAITLPVDPVPVGTSVALSATYTDANPTDTHAAAIDWEAGATAGAVNGANGTGMATGSFTYTAPGVHTVSVAVTDEGGRSGTRSSHLDLPAYVVVYDPTAGFVTGGGWIWSSANACTWAGCAADGSTVGKARFGFVSRYRRGASTPDGNAEFHFEAGDLAFRSTSYDWLVVAGARAQFKGVGTIGGSGDFGFLITAIDGAATGGGGADRFRIKIWDRVSGEVVYDNHRGELEDSNAATLLGGGSIVIHR